MVGEERQRGNCQGGNRNTRHRDNEALRHKGNTKQGCRVKCQDFENNFFYLLSIYTEDEL